MAVRSRLVNHEVIELLHRLGCHNWKLSEPENAYLCRYLFLSVLQGLKTLGIPVENQDPVLRPEVIPVPFFDRVPPMPPTIEANDILEDITEVVAANGHSRNV
jgi:hypothetical protein